MNSAYLGRSLVCAGLLVAALPMVGKAEDPHAAHWTYSGPDSPEHWGELDPAFAACAHGHAQSPIDISQTKLADLPALTPDYKAAPFNIIDNGHSIQVNVPTGSSLTVGGKVYVLKQLHFHHPSEEHIKGAQFPLVAHLVHQDAEGHVAVVAVLFTQGNGNPALDSIWRNLPAQKGIAVDVAAASLQIHDLLPTNLGYFTFDGSLTTPPCTEGVVWYVLKSHPTVSAEQIAIFAKIYPRDARPIQPGNGRVVLESR